MRHAWILLFAGIASELAGTTGMRALAFDSPALSQLSATAGIVVSYFLVSRAVETIPIGVAYAIWSGVGIGGVSILSRMLFAEPMSWIKVLGIVLVIAGMAIINLDPDGEKGDG